MLIKCLGMKTSKMADEQKNKHSDEEKKILIGIYGPLTQNPKINWRRAHQVKKKTKLITNNQRNF